MHEFSKKKVLLFFYIFDFALIFLFALLIIPFGKSYRRHEKSSYILSEKNKENVYEIVLSHGQSEIVLRNNDFFWTGTDSGSFSGDTLIWPCDEERMQNFLKNLTNIVKMSKISDSFTQSDPFFVDDFRGFSVSFYQKSGNLISSCVFGNVDPVSGLIYFRKSDSDEVFLINDVWSPFLSVKTSSWCDPYVFPRALTDFSYNKSQGLLRRGQLVSGVEKSALNRPFNTLTFDFASGRRIVYSVFLQDDSYIFSGKYYSGPGDSLEYKNALSLISYDFSVSAWTYEKLVSMEAYVE